MIISFKGNQHQKLLDFTKKACKVAIKQKIEKTNSPIHHCLYFRNKLKTNLSERKTQNNYIKCKGKHCF